MRCTGILRILRTSSSEVQRLLSILIDHRSIRFCFQQQIHNGNVAIAARFVQRRQSERVGLLNLHSTKFNTA